VVLKKPGTNLKFNSPLGIRRGIRIHKGVVLRMLQCYATDRGFTLLTCSIVSGVGKTIFGTENMVFSFVAGTLEASGIFEGAVTISACRD
jgi:hypothetical protein